MAIRIGDAVSLSNPSSEQITPDDRQQLIETIGGVVVQDFGHIAAGDKISWELVLKDLLAAFGSLDGVCHIALDRIALQRCALRLVRAAQVTANSFSALP